MTYYRPVFTWGVLVSLICILCACQAGGRDTAASEKATRDKVILRDTVTHPSMEQLPEYEYGTEDYADCPYLDATSTSPEGNIRCFYATTDARDPELLALVVSDITQVYGMEGDVMQVSFYESRDSYDSASGRPFAEGLVFASKDAAEDVAASEGVNLSEATHWHGAYVFEGFNVL